MLHAEMGMIPFSSARWLEGTVRYLLLIFNTRPLKRHRKKYPTTRLLTRAFFIIRMKISSSFWRKRSKSAVPYLTWDIYPEATKPLLQKGKQRSRQLKHYFPFCEDTVSSSWLFI